MEYGQWSSYLEISQKISTFIVIGYDNAIQCRKANARKFLSNFFQAADIRISLPLSKKYGEY